MVNRIFCVALVLLLVGCANRQAPPKSLSWDIGEDKARQTDDQMQRGDQTQHTGKEQPAAEYFGQSGPGINLPEPVRRLEKGNDGQIQLTFKNTDIRIVLQAVLSDALAIKYEVDPRVDGTISLESSAPMSPAALRSALEAALKTRGYALVPLGGFYRVMPLQEAPQRLRVSAGPNPPSAGLPGFTVHALVPENVTPSALADLLQPFAAPNSILLVNDARNVLVLGATASELDILLETARTFDVDWMQGKRFALFPIRYAEVDAIVDELAEIIQGAGGQTPQARLVALPRINRLLAIAPSDAALKEIERWVGRLDIGGSAPGRRIYVYPVQNGRAQDLAQSLNQLLGIGFNNFGLQQGAGLGANPRQSTGIVQGRTGQQRQNQIGPNDGIGVGLDQLRIVPAVESNSIMVWATPTEFATIEAALDQLDIPPLQVLIEATLAEISLTDELRYGLQWQFEFNDNLVNLGTVGNGAPQAGGFSWFYTNGTDASVILNAVASLTDVNVISNPKIMVLNNESASLQVGDEVPVPTSSAVSVVDTNAPIVNSIQFRNTGVILTVTPRINQGGLVLLDIEQEVSDVVETSTSGIDAPTIQQRRLNSSVAVSDGQTIALGGLIRNSVSYVNSGVPLLKDIPLLGNAFKETDIIERRSELIILLTPRIVRNRDETRETMRELREQFRGLFPAQKDGEEADADQAS